ncbi:MAG: CNNM domain-containing protein [Candidatus Saccharimonadales bacterium]
MSILILIFEILALITISALCSGLNISLMALSLGDLKRKAKLGDVSAKRVLPLRRKSHLTLSSILLANVAVISTTSLVLDDHFHGLIAGIVSTLLIVIFGEVIPQALFAKNALAFTARFAPFLKFLVFVTYIISRPLELLLNKLVGNHKQELHSRGELGIIINEQIDADESELDEDEAEIIKSVLQMSEKRVRDIMTSIDDVFWVTPDYIIDTKTIEKIKREGRSRIPIFDTNLTRCYGVLLIKDLLAYDFDDPIAVDDLSLHPVKIVGSMTALDTMFRKFISAHTHLIPIERDDHIVGIVTIEDLIEEILGHEIEDETDYKKKASRRN